MFLHKRLVAAVTVLVAACCLIAAHSQTAYGQTNPGFRSGCELGANVNSPCSAGGTQPTSLNGAFAAKQDWPAITQTCGTNNTTVATTAYVANCVTGGGGGTVTSVGEIG